MPDRQPEKAGKRSRLLTGNETSAVARFVLFLVIFVLLSWAGRALGVPWWGSVCAAIVGLLVERMLMLWSSRRA